MPQDILQQAKEQYRDAKDAVSEQEARMREDLKFSNPAMPEQWPDEALKSRKGRPSLTMDRTNQFIAQVVNDARQNKPSIQVLPADSRADPEVAKRLNGIIRHIEYTSRAGIAYDTAIEYGARVGLGWIRVLPKVIRPESNEQEITIQRVHDPLSIVLDPNSVEPDGSDAMHGFAETTLTRRAFERMYPKAKVSDWDSDGWFTSESVRICEYFKVVEEKANRLMVSMPDGQRLSMGEDEYWELSKTIGFKPQVFEQFEARTRKVKWCKLTGSEVLEETEFPSQWVPLIPVLGYELWVEGKRYLCGMLRRMRDSQLFHNYEMSALVEAMATQPKAPFLLPLRAIVGNEQAWNALNSGNPAYLPYNDIDPDDPQAPQIAPPIRLSPPAFPASFANGITLSVSEMEASVGMYKSNLGAPSNAQSGKAKLADQREGDTANFHYIDNLRRSMEHMGRIVVDMIPAIYDTRRQAKIMGEDGSQTSVEINPDMESAVQRQGNKIIAINPGLGAYDVRVKVGPSYTSMREETSAKLVELSQGNPGLAAALSPLLVKMTDMPEAEKIAKVAIALLPPPVQQIYSEDEEDEIPPGVKAQLQGQAQQIEQMAGAMEQAATVIQQLKSQVETKNEGLQAQAQLEMAKIKAAEANLRALEADIEAKREALAQELENAKLQLQLQAQQVAAVPAESEPAPSPQKAGGQQRLEISVSDSEHAMAALAQAVQAAQVTMVAALEQNTQTVAQLQAATMGAIEDMAEAVSAPREIVLRRGPDGRAAGAVSMPVMNDE